MNKGFYISGVGHLVLILWVLLGGVLFRAKESPFEFANVSVISSADFAALQEAAAPAEAEPPAAEPETPPEPAAVAEPQPKPQPEPQPEPAPEPAPEPPPAPEPAAPPPRPDAGSTVLTNESDAPAPQEADTVAETETEAPAEQLPEAPVETPAARPEPAPAETPPVPQQEPAAPPPTTTAIITEADRPGAGGGALAPNSSLRPRARPERLAAAPAPQPERPAEPAPAAAPQEERRVEDAIAQAAADAVAQALAQSQGQSAATSERGGTGLAASGPPLTGGERDGFRLAVQACWVVDPGSEASRVSVTVGFDLDQAGKVVNGPTLVSNSGGSEAAVRTAFEAARRAILRCQRGGFELPAEKYEQWREVEMTFDARAGRVQ